MRLLPERGLLPESWSPLARRLAWTSLVLAAVGGIGLVALWWWSDRLLAGLYGHWRPTLERQIGRVMGRPLQLGPYRGLGAEGLRVGPSRLLPGPQDGSTANVESVLVRIDPLASWRQRAAVLDLSFGGARVDLRRNAKGQIWVLGPVQPGQEPPRLDLRFRLPEPARVRLWGLGPGAGPLELTATGQVGLRTHHREIDLRARVKAPGRAGWAAVVGEGQWQARRWRAEILPRGLALAPFQSLLRLPGRLGGEAEGRITLSLMRGVSACTGGLDLRRVRWLPSGATKAAGSASATTAVEADRLALRCQERTLTLAPSRWRYGAWSGWISGRGDADRRLALLLRTRPPAGNPLGELPIEASLRGRWAEGALQVADLDGRRGGSRLQASGRLGSRLALAGRWTLAPAELPRAERLPAWLKDRPLQGSLEADGRLVAPRLRATTGQPSHPLVGPWQASLLWSDGLLRLNRFSAPHLQASAELPLGFRPGRGLVWGELEARLGLSGFPLARLDPLVGTRLQGRLDASGAVRGPLASLRPDLAFTVDRPGAGPLLLQERWQGTLVADATPPAAGPGAGGGLLRLSALAPAPPGRIEARLDRRWLPQRVALERRGGRLELQGRPNGYRWSASGFPLQGLALALGRDRRFQTLQGDLSGKGTLSLQPLAFNGRVDLLRPQFLGVGGRRVEATVAYAGRDYSIKGRVEPLAAGTIDVVASGRWQGPIRAEFQARQLNSVLFRQMAEGWSRWRGAPPSPSGQAADLGALAIDPEAGNLFAQLLALQQARALAELRDRQATSASRAERLAKLQIGIDADLVVSGPDLRRARADLTARGHVWKGYAGRDQPVTSDPFEVRLEGPLGLGGGSFSASGLSLALLDLLVPVPASLRGQLALRGRYRLGGARPELEVELALAEGELRGRGLTLERGTVELKGEALAVDLALRAAGAFNSVDLSGTIPLDARRSALELRLASRDDGLHFLADLGGDAFAWKRGSADLQLLVRGSLSDPIANGFLRLRDGECRFIGQTVKDVQATVLFDFEQMLVQELTARVGPRGQLRGEGKIGLVRPLTAEQSLGLTLKEVPFALPRITAVADGRLGLGGSLRSPELGGELTLSRGSINASPGQLTRSAPVSNQPAQPVSLNELLESGWDFRQPLVLLGPDVESQTGESLRQAIPRFPYLAFEGLRLSFGKDLLVVLPNVANFTTAGSLRISGRLDPTLRATGVVRLLRGRLNLFTTTFSLDPDAPNVAIFTPSLGLVPYLDIALRTRISDSLNVIAPSGVPAATGLAGGTGANTTSLADLGGQGGFSSLSQLQLILVTVSVSGPADRIAENIRLRSSPPLPQERLVALIGGNSLAGLSGGGAGTALATVVGQSLLSPLLATLSDAFGQRVSLALYPTYVNPSISSERELFSRRVPPQLVLGAEVGYDLSDRFNVSVLAAPNRSDVAPQFTFTYRASQNFNLQGSFDSQGAWQGQLQMFFRF